MSHQERIEVQYLDTSKCRLQGPGIKTLSLQLVDNLSTSSATATLNAGATKPAELQIVNKWKMVQQKKTRDVSN